MKTAIDFLPLALYLAAYVVADIYVATAVLVVAMALQVAYWKITQGTIGKLPWLNFALAAVFGGLTLMWKDPRYLVLRATAMYWIVAAALVLTYWIAGRNLVQLALESHVRAPDTAWRRSLYSYALFFAALGAGNLVLGHMASQAVWVAFDSIGVLVLIAAFAAAHFIGLKRRYESRAEAPAGNQ